MLGPQRARHFQRYSREVAWFIKFGRAEQLTLPQARAATLVKFRKVLSSSGRFRRLLAFGSLAPPQFCASDEAPARVCSDLFFPIRILRARRLGR